MWQTGPLRKELLFEKHSIITTIKYYIKKEYYRLKGRVKGSQRFKLGYPIN